MSDIKLVPYKGKYSGSQIDAAIGKIPSIENDLLNKQEKLSKSQLDAVNSGITSSKVEELSAKQDQLSEQQMAAVNSGISSEDVKTISTNKSTLTNVIDRISDIENSLESKADVSSLASTNAVVETVSTKTEELQGEIDQIVISASAESVVAPEVAQARVSSDSTVYQTLKERLDAGETFATENIFSVNENKFSSDINIKGLWEQGHLTDAGKKGDSEAPFYAKRIRTKSFVPSTVKYITSTSDVTILAYKYKPDGTFVSFTSVNSGYYELNSTYKYMIAIGLNTNANITTDIFSKLSMYLSSIKDVLSNLEEAAGSYSELSTRLNTNDAALSEINRQLMQKGTNMSPSETSDNYKLVGNGLGASDENAILKKYAVTAGDTLYLKIAKVHTGVYQWQSSATVKVKSPTTGVISISTEAVDGYVVVPDGATYLIVSEEKGSSTNEVATTEKVSSRAILYGYLVDNNRQSLWEQGALTDTGNNGSSTAPFYPARIRTKSFIPNMDRLTVDSAYSYIIYRYNSDGTFVDYSKGNSENYNDFDFENYKYRLVLGKIGPTTLTPISVDEYSNAYFLEQQINSTRDNFDKSANTDFGVVPTTYYRGLGSDYSTFGQDTMYSEIVTAFDTISGLEKSELGLSSDNRMIVGYTYTPKRTAYYKTLSKEMPKIIIISAQHGFEKSSTYGLYYFLKDLTERYESSEILSYIHDNVQLVIVPVCNPYGFDNNSYLNANGVNLNRNYLCDAWAPSTPDTTEYGGTEPFSEPETQIVRDLVLANKDAYLFFDYHTNGGGSVDENKKINWHSYRTSSSDYYNKMKYASARHITRITSMFAKDYNINFRADEVAGYIDAGNKVASSEKWAYDNNIIGITFEGFNGFKGEDAYTEREKKANSELIGNFIAEALRCYSNSIY